MTKLEEMLEQAASIVILGHVNPDGDCTGACLAMYNYIKTLSPSGSEEVFLPERV